MRVAVITCRVEAPFEHVAGDDQGPGNGSILGDLRVGPDVDHGRPRVHRRERLGRADALEPLARLLEEFIDRRSRHWRMLMRAGGDNARVAYDEDLANLIRELLAEEPDVVEKKMFGGLAFLIGGNMSVAASGQGGLMLRCDPADTDALLAKPHAAPFEMRGRVMDGWLRVDREGVRTKSRLRPWVKRGVAYARTLPPKR
jgi:TfoX/Sxy family transcriptional regulator of competence genes